MDYNLAQSPAGRVKVEKELTPARRYSFLVGKNESSHTAQVQLLPILQNDERKPLLADFEKAFNIEVVTREFYKKYRDLFIDVKEALEYIIGGNSKAKEDFDAKGIDPVNFSKKLLGQIVFLYFLQKKGWFGVGRDEVWGSGPKDFLRRLFNREIIPYDNFFNDILEPLFYEALAVERTDDFYSRFNCKIPFLNGGLFDPINNYDWVHTDILLPNELFSNTEKTQEGDIGTGILDVFDRYNFTVKEDEPLDKEVAVDPEMLGKVFENLLEVKDRKSKGTYYTPREIVHYMCQESLINYLDTALNTGELPLVKEKPTNLKLFGAPAVQQQALKTQGNVNRVQREDIEAFVRIGELAIEHDSRVEAYGKETERYSYKLPESIRLNAKLIDDKLAEIRVCDPAIGSGAFPVGLMTEIVRARNTLTTYLPDKTGRTNYNFKRHAIQNCLYGVDIDPGAVEIAKLRLWLSLVVDEEDIKQIQPLPNLDYKIVCGNSLLGVQRDMFNNELFQKLEELKPLYFNETNAKKKQEYRKQIDNLIKELTNNNETFDFEVYFSEVFHEKGGFDVVIANPPYISYGLRGAQKMSEEEKNFLKRVFPDSAEYKISLYAIFMDKAIQLCSSNGIQTLIVPDSFLMGRYFSKIRNIILRKNNILELLLLPYGVFDATVGFSVVYLFQRTKSPNTSHKIIARFVDSKENLLNRTLKSFSYPQDYFRGLNYNRFRLFFDQQIMGLVTKIEKDGVPLSKIIDLNSGLIGKDGKDSIVSDRQLNAHWLPGIISGGEIHRFILKPEGYYILYKKDKIHSGYECVEYFEDKIFMRQTGDSLICAIDNIHLLCLNNVHVGNLRDNRYSLKYVAAIINSTLLNYYYRSLALESGRAMAQTDIEILENLPIKKTDKSHQQQIVNIVDEILAITGNQDYQSNPAKQARVKELEHQIDHMVYELYGLTPEEIAIVEGKTKQNI
jgi:type I restriction-modification system DNA methylase subunit